MLILVLMCELSGISCLHCMVVREDSWMVLAITADIAPGHQQDLMARASLSMLHEPLQCLKTLLCFPPSQCRRLTLLLHKQQQTFAEGSGGRGHLLFRIEWQQKLKSVQETGCLQD